MANNFYGAITLTGGGAGALDAIDGAGLADLDAAFVSLDGITYIYSLDATSAAAEDDPVIIKPDSNAGNKRWIMQTIGVNDGSISLPAFRFASQISTGFALLSSSNLGIMFGGLQFWEISNEQFGGISGNRPSFLSENSTNTNPSIVAKVSDKDTGIGSPAADQLSLIAGGVEGIRVSEAASVITIDLKGLLTNKTNAVITASTSQSQGNGALTAQVNEVSIVEFDDDTVTLPSAADGLKITIINNGANTLQIFPALDDNLGTGVDVSEQLEPNEVVDYVAYDTTNWKKESSTEIIHAEMHDEDNTDNFVINDAGGDFHSYHTNGLAGGDLADWTFDIGGGGTSFPIASIADGAASGVDIAVTTTGDHGLAQGDIISQTNLATAAYVGIFIVKAIISSTVYEVAAVFDDDVTGTMDQASTLIAGVGSAGVYFLSYWISATLTSASNETFDFQLVKGATTIVGTKVRRKFGTSSDFGASSGGGVVSIADGDKISLAISNEDGADDITIRNFTLVLTRL